MPATTAAGLPYPLPADPITDGANLIRDLAESIQAGRATIVITANNTSTASTVTFPKAFKSAPVVVVTGIAGSPQNITVGANLITATRFEARATRLVGSGNIDVTWIAIGELA